MIVPLRHPALFKVPEFQEFLRRAFSRTPWRTDDILEHLEKTITLPRISTILNVEQGEYLGIAVVALPESKLDPFPQIIHLYSEGPIRNRKVIIQAVVDFMEERGYTKVWAVNYTGKPDKVYQRVMKPQGWEVKPIGSIMEFSR